MIRKLLIVTIAWAIAAAAPGAATPTRERFATMNAVAKSVSVHRAGALSTLQWLKANPVIVQASEAMPSREAKQELREAWSAFYEYELALESARQSYRDHFKRKGVDREKSLVIHYAAFLAGYRSALEFIEEVERNPSLHTVLDEPVAELGLPGGGYAAMKFRYLHAGRAADLIALETLYRAVGGSLHPELRRNIESDRAFVLMKGTGRGEVMTAHNALRVVQSGVGDALFPLQTGVSEWMGDTKVARKNRSLIAASQIRDMNERLEPGDILLERREWYLSNVGLPGFWPHAAIFIGTPATLDAYFRGDAETNTWLQSQGAKTMSELLASRNRATYAKRLQGENGHPFQVIEAISEGVTFTSLEHSADADSVAALRPRLSKKEKAIAIVRAFAYVGRPYDFNFDFLTDEALVCTELVYKSFEPSPGYSGLRLPVLDLVGRKATPANEIARLFDAEAASATRQFDFIFFVDGVESLARARPATIAEFRESWKRPKWHIVTAK